MNHQRIRSNEGERTEGGRGTNGGCEAPTDIDLIPSSGNPLMREHVLSLSSFFRTCVK